jgi:hypothetical protein
VKMIGECRRADKSGCGGRSGKWDRWDDSLMKDLTTTYRMYR